MPTPHFSNLFQTILLDIVNPFLKLDDQSFRRLYQVFFYCPNIDLFDHELGYCQLVYSSTLRLQITTFS